MANANTFGFGVTPSPTHAPAGEPAILWRWTKVAAANCSATVRRIGSSSQASPCERVLLVETIIPYSSGCECVITLRARGSKSVPLRQCYS